MGLSRAKMMGISFHHICLRLLCITLNLFIPKRLWQIRLLCSLTSSLADIKSQFESLHRWSSPQSALLLMTQWNIDCPQTFSIYTHRIPNEPMASLIYIQLFQLNSQSHKVFYAYKSTSPFCQIKSHPQTQDPSS